MTNAPLKVEVTVPNGDVGQLKMTYDPANPSGLVGHRHAMYKILGLGTPMYVADRPQNGISTELGVFDITERVSDENGLRATYERRRFT